VALHFRKIYRDYKTYRHEHYQTFFIMHPLEVYYLRQAGHGSGQYDTGTGPIFSTSHFLHRGRVIGTFR